MDAQGAIGKHHAIFGGASGVAGAPIRPNDQVSIRNMSDHIACLEGAWVADAFRIWDGDDAQWRTDLAVIFRFESIDLMIGNDHGSITLALGALDAQGDPLPFTSSTRTIAPENPFAQHALRWARHPLLSQTIGGQVLSAFLHRSSDQREATGLTITLDGSLNIEASCSNDRLAVTLMETPPGPAQTPTPHPSAPPLVAQGKLPASPNSKRASCPATPPPASV